MVKVMDNVIISKVCGLCAGCNNAITTAKQKYNSGKNVVLFKEIVHNPHVNKMFEDMGITIVDNLEQITPYNHVIIRAHGEPPETYDYLTQNNIEFSDCTCVNVAKIHEMVTKYSNDGFGIIILGKYGKSNGKMHPETKGTIGWCKTEPILIEDAEDVEKIKTSTAEKFYLVCQTTFNEEKANAIIQEISDVCKLLNKELITNKSICGAQKNINKYSVEVSTEVDLMIVVGGKNSSNSRELFNNLKQYKPSIFIEEVEDWFEELKTINFEFTTETKVGLTAGASTPKEELFELKQLIENKQMELRNEN